MLVDKDGNMQLHRISVNGKNVVTDSRYCNISLSLKILSYTDRVSMNVNNVYSKNSYSGSPNLLGGTPLVILVDCLGVGTLAGVEFLFCNAGGTVGMASTVLVVGPLGIAGGISASTGAC